MQAVASLGSQFYAFVAGSVVSVGLTAYTSMFLGDSVPSEWGYIVASAGATTLAAAVWAYLAIVVSDLEASISALPRNIDTSQRREMSEVLVHSVGSRLNFTAALGSALTVIGVGLLPVRLLL